MRNSLQTSVIILLLGIRICGMPAHGQAPRVKVTTEQLLAGYQRQLAVAEHIRFREIGRTNLTGKSLPEASILIRETVSEITRTGTSGKSVVTDRLRLSRGSGARSWQRIWGEVVWSGPDWKSLRWDNYESNVVPNWNSMSVGARLRGDRSVYGTVLCSPFLFGTDGHIQVVPLIRDFPGKPEERRKDGKNFWAIEVKTGRDEPPLPTATLLFDKSPPYLFREWRFHFDAPFDTRRPSLPLNPASREAQELRVPRTVRSWTGETVVTEHKEFDGIPIPIGFVRKVTMVYSEHVTRIETTESALQDVRVGIEELTPEDLTFSISVPDGTPVEVYDDREVAYVWQDSRVVKAMPGGLLHAMKESQFQEAPRGTWIVPTVVGLTVALVAGGYLFVRWRRSSSF